MSFSTINLTNDRVLVKGTDVHGTTGETVLDGSQWAEVKAHSQHLDAHEAFDSAVEEFFRPLTEASEALAKPVTKVDPNATVVLQEEVEPTAGTQGIVVSLTRESQILRLIEGGNTDRLIWVGDDLEIVELVSAPAAEVATEFIG